MSLRSKIVAILLAVVALYAAVDNGTLRLFAARFFGGWEEHEGASNLRRVRAAVDEEVARLEDVGRVWASWDSVHGFLSDPGSARSAEFVRSNLEGGRALDAAQADLMYLCDEKGIVWWSTIRDPESREEIRLTRELPSGALAPNHPLLNVKQGEETVSGLMMTSRLPLLTASVPVRDLSGHALVDRGERFQRATYGFVILGRFLDQDLRHAIGAPSNIEVEVVAPADARIPGGLGRDELLARLTAGETDVVSAVDDEDRLSLFASINDLRTQEPLLVAGRMERDIAALGSKAVDYALLSTLASALLILFVLLRLLRRIVLDPLEELTVKAVEIGKRDDTTIRTGLDRDDEIGQLSDEFDRMLERLAESRAQVVATARKAGMSEIATGVLHNVGNVLNSVNVSANLVRKNAEQLSVKDLEMMVEILRANQDDIGRFVTDDPRGRHLLPFLFELTNTLAKQRREILGELASLGSGIDHISDLVRSQQTYAGTKGVFEYARLAEEVESALRICSQALGNLYGVEVVREFEELESIKVDKHKLMEILVNLIQNSHQALKESGRPDKRITLRILRTSAESVRIEVEDNGIGIPPENLERVFHHGFTTRSDGHGFGLHTASNAATEMDGSLGACSAGLGTGATFYLDLPLRENELAHAA